jgi:hypothetical protein
MLPAFMFAPGQVYDKLDIEAGYLENSHLMRAVSSRRRCISFHSLFVTQAVKHVYQGAGGALEGPGAHKGRAGNAAINGITALTPRDIAYVACQVSFLVLQIS